MELVVITAWEVVGAEGETGLVGAAPAVVLVTAEVVEVALLELVTALRAWKAAALL